MGADPSEGTPCHSGSPGRTPDGMLCAYMKILIVDEDRSTVATRREMLQDLDTVAATDDSLHALGAFRRQRPDLVILDYLMPRHSGLEVLKTIKQEEPGTFVVFLTRFAPETVARLQGVHRADAVLEKPLERAQLERLLAKVARRRAARHA